MRQDGGRKGRGQVLFFEAPRCFFCFSFKSFMCCQLLPIFVPHEQTPDICSSGPAGLSEEMAWRLFQRLQSQLSWQLGQARQPLPSWVFLCAGTSSPAGYGPWHIGETESFLSRGHGWTPPSHSALAGISPGGRGRSSTGSPSPGPKAGPEVRRDGWYQTLLRDRGERGEPHCPQSLSLSHQKSSLRPLSHHLAWTLTEKGPGDPFPPESSEALGCHLFREGGGWTTIIQIGELGDGPWRAHRYP